MRKSRFRESQIVGILKEGSQEYPIHRRADGHDPSAGRSAFGQFDLSARPADGFGA